MKSVIKGELDRQPLYGTHSRFFGQNKNLPFTIYGDNLVLCPGAVVYAGTKLGNHVFIGDNASIRENCIIGDNVMIGRNVTIEPNTIIGDGTKIQTGTHITGDCFIGNDVFIGPEVTTMNDKYMDDPTKKTKIKGPHIGNKVKIGGNATILPGVIIGAEAVIGAGSVITKDVPPGVTIVGNPGKIIKWRYK